MKRYRITPSAAPELGGRVLAAMAAENGEDFGMTDRRKTIRRRARQAAYTGVSM